MRDVLSKPDIVFGVFVAIITVELCFLLIGLGLIGADPAALAAR